LDAWRNGPGFRRAYRHHQFPNYNITQAEPTSYDSAQSPPQEDYTDEEDEIIGNDPVSTSNSSITSLEEDISSNEEEATVEFEMTAPLKEALETLNKHLIETNEPVHSTVSFQ
jgi:hypothetical protein